MRKNTLLIFVMLFVLCHISEAVQAQGRGRSPVVRRAKSKKSSDPFEKSQWWIGIKLGANLTQAIPEARYTPFSATDGRPAETYDKTYQDFSEWGAQAGLDINFFYNGFTVSFQPNFRRQRFTYSNQYIWFDPEDAQNTLSLDYTQDNKLDYIELPLMIKYDILRTAFRPTVFVGGFYATLVEAQKALSITGTDLASGGVSEFQGEEIIVGARDLFNNTSLGLVGGVGCSYNVGNVRFALDVAYRYGLNNISNACNRYTNQRLVGVGDIMDDIKLRNLSVSFSCLFPMRFLRTGSFRAVD